MTITISQIHVHKISCNWCNAESPETIDKLSKINWQGWFKLSCIPLYEQPSDNIHLCQVCKDALLELAESRHDLGKLTKALKKGKR